MLRILSWQPEAVKLKNMLWKYTSDVSGKYTLYFTSWPEDKAIGGEGVWWDSKSSCYDGSIVVSEIYLVMTL